MKTKRIISLILAIGIMMSLFTCTAVAADEAELRINGEKQTYALSLTGSIGKYHILAPAEEFSAALGASFAWNKNNNLIVVTKGETTIVFTAESAVVVINGKAEALDAPAKIIAELPYVPVDFVGRQFGYHVFSEIAGKRVRIVSKTSTTAPALTQKEGMATLVSEVHRPVPTEFTKSNALDDLIFAREDYSDAVITTEDTKDSVMPDGEIIFSQEDFFAEADKSNDGVENWFDDCMQTQIVDSEDVPDIGKISMDVWMQRILIGRGTNYNFLPFDKALRMNITETMQSSQDKQIHFAKKLPEPQAKDKYALTFYARLIEGGDPDYGTGKVEVRVQQPVTYKQTLVTSVEFGKEWKRFDFLLTGTSGPNTIVFLPMHHVQTIEIGGFEVRDIGENADISYFNQKKSDPLAEELKPDAPWRTEALDRIEEVRKGDFKVVVKDKNGNPVKDAEVELDMFEHEFKFGIAMDQEYVTDDKFEGYIVANNGEKEAEFISRIGSDFNATSQANRLKWDVYHTDAMNNPGKTSTARIVMNEGINQGLKYHRGHALWMPVNTLLTAEPRAMYDLLEDDSRPLDERYADLLGFIEEHFARMDAEFPELYEWDVTNETHVRTFFTGKFGERILRDVYRIADEKLTHGQKLMLTDNAQFTQHYWERLDDFKDWGVKYDSLGMQGHSVIGSNDINNNYRPQKWLEVWDRFAYEYQKTFAVTEFSVGALKDEYGYDGQGDYMRDIMIAAYSHPACTGFTMWWLCDYWMFWESPYNPVNPMNNDNGAGLAPLYTQDFVGKPGLNIYRDLVYNKWWTRDAKTTTNVNGEGTVKGFYGDYDVTVKVGGQVVKTEMAAFHKGYDNVLTITIN